ncbi:MAG: dihydrodipicolinate synthase family protein, partial [Sphaerochaetaceae bacterium]|nr:dihydrodipicolinate synthase family protein [Sphaerochaetaceae bacterium]
MHNHEKALEVFSKGTVIPATPLSITEDRKLDEKTLRLLMKYYLNCGVGGIATAVHSTQFEIRKYGMFEQVISIVSEEVDKFEEETGNSVFKICAACGPIKQAVSEAKTAKKHGYDAILLSPGGLNDRTEDYLLERVKAIAEVLPVVGFYLQTAVGGRVLSYDYWSKMAEIDNVIGFKCASFNRYTTIDVMRAVALSSRFDKITMYTGNDDNIVSDLITDFTFTSPNGNKTIMFKGGLLGHWCMWTKKAVE